jgi:sugar/nucleoside kinase (ribokinase family)
MTPSSRAVLVVGDVMLDVIAAPRDPIEIGSDTPAAITLLPGGSGANLAAWLGYLGNEVYFVGRAGGDRHAADTAALRMHGVEPIVAADERKRTGVLVNLISSGGERSFLTDRGANDELTRSDLPDALLGRVGLVHLSGYALTALGPRAAVLDFLAAAAAREIPISVDPGSLALLRGVGPAEFVRWTRAARICFPNAAEAAMLAGTADPGAAVDILGAYYATVVIKRGPAGALAATDFGTRRWSAPAPAVKPVDTTGAGDAFVAGYLSAHMRGVSTTDCLTAAVAAGSAAVSHYGGRPPSPAPGPEGPPLRTELARCARRCAEYAAPTAGHDFARGCARHAGAGRAPDGSHSAQRFDEYARIHGRADADRNGHRTNGRGHAIARALERTRRAALRRPRARGRIG